VEFPGIGGQYFNPEEGLMDVHEDNGQTRSQPVRIHQQAHRHKHSVQAMCRLLGVAPSGYYAWLAQPVSDHAQEDARLLRLIRASFTASQGIYGAPRVFLDLREAGEGCSSTASQG